MQTHTRAVICVEFLEPGLILCNFEPSLQKFNQKYSELHTEISHFIPNFGYELSKHFLLFTLIIFQPSVLNRGKI